MKKGDKKWYESISNWLFLIACIICIPIILMNLSIMMQAKKNKDVVPSVFGIKPFMVLSGSMETEIQIGDLILTKVIDPQTLRVNDVIAFRDAEGTVTTHRIIDIVVQEGVTYFITKGDNNNSQDRNLVEYEDVEGIYIGRIPGIGSMMKSLSEPTTVMIIIIGITAVFVIGFTISNRRQREAERLEYLEYKRQKELEQNPSYKEETRYKQEVEEAFDQVKEEITEYKEEKLEEDNNEDDLIDLNAALEEESKEDSYIEAEVTEINTHKEEKQEDIVEEEPTIEEEVVETSETTEITEEEVEEPIEEDSKEETTEPEVEESVQEQKTPEEIEHEEFLEYKRMKEQREREEQEERERQEFLEFKRYKAQLEKERLEKESKNNEV